MTVIREVNQKTWQTAQDEELQVRSVVLDLMPQLAQVFIDKPATKCY